MLLPGVEENLFWAQSKFSWPLLLCQLLLQRQPIWVWWMDGLDNGLCKPACKHLEHFLATVINQIFIIKHLGLNHITYLWSFRRCFFAYLVDLDFIFELRLIIKSTITRLIQTENKTRYKYLITTGPSLDRPRCCLSWLYDLSFKRLLFHFIEVLVWLNWWHFYAFVLMKSLQVPKKWIKNLSFITMNFLFLHLYLAYLAQKCS